MPENISITRAAKIVKKRLRVWCNEFNSTHSIIAYLYITKIFNFVRTLEELTRRSQFTIPYRFRILLQSERILTNRYLILYRFWNSPSIIEDINKFVPCGRGLQFAYIVWQLVWGRDRTKW